MHRILPASTTRRLQSDVGLLLIDTASNRLFAYNETARQVWDFVEAGGARGDVVLTYAAAWNIPMVRAENDVNAILTEWSGLGLLEGGASSNWRQSGIGLQKPSTGAQLPFPAGPRSGHLRSAVERSGLRQKPMFLAPFMKCSETSKRLASLRT
jgi:Coenzyme PQQ synthesis protein D (PqqD)